MKHLKIKEFLAFQGHLHEGAFFPEQSQLESLLKEAKELKYVARGLDNAVIYCDNKEPYETAVILFDNLEDDTKAVLYIPENKIGCRLEIYEIIKEE